MFCSVTIFGKSQSPHVLVELWRVFQAPHTVRGSFSSTAPRTPEQLSSPNHMHVNEYLRKIYLRYVVPTGAVKNAAHIQLYGNLLHK